MIQKQLARRRPGQSDLSTPVRLSDLLPRPARPLTLAFRPKPRSATSSTRSRFNRVSRTASRSAHRSASWSATRTSARTTTPRPTSTRGRRTPTGRTSPSTASRPAAVADGLPPARPSVRLLLCRLPRRAVAHPFAALPCCRPCRRRCHRRGVPDGRARHPDRRLCLGRRQHPPALVRRRHGRAAQPGLYGASQDGLARGGRQGAHAVPQRRDLGQDGRRTSDRRAEISTLTLRAHPPLPLSSSASARPRPTWTRSAAL
jgi:hypothetical protein